MNTRTPARTFALTAASVAGAACLFLWSLLPLARLPEPPVTLPARADSGSASPAPLDISAFTAALRPLPAEPPAPAPALPPPAPPEPSPILGLTLLGIINDGVPAALIHDETSGAISRARVGDAVRPDLTLTQIDAARVRFSHPRAGELVLEVAP